MSECKVPLGKVNTIKEDCRVNLFIVYFSVPLSLAYFDFKGVYVYRSINAYVLFREE